MRSNAFSGSICERATAWRVEDPSFPGIIDLVAASGYGAVPLALDDDGPLPDAVAAALGRGCSAIIVTPRAQNPTGAAVGTERASELRRVLRGFPDVVLIENDYAGAGCRRPPALAAQPVPRAVGGRALHLEVSGARPARRCDGRR